MPEVEVNVVVKMVPMIYTLYGFAIFFFIFWCAMWLIHLVAIFYGWVEISVYNLKIAIVT